MKTLPDKAWELLTLAKEDLLAMEKVPGYIISMGDWHNPVVGTCYICMAGSVMAKTLEMPKDQRLVPIYFPREIDLKLRAINLFRLGDICNGCILLNIHHCNIPDIDVPEYKDNRDGFFAGIDEVINILKENNL